MRLKICRIICGAAKVITSLLFFSNASAIYAATDDSDAIIEEVVVTGSRIAKDGFEYSSPVTVYDSDQLILAGNASIDEFLKNVPQFTGYQMGTSTNNGSDEGQKKVDVRGLGFERTLVLINGRRTIGDASGDGAVDLNNIPAPLVKRVEVLADGASSVYGSDALAGVVNFVLDDSFEGLEINASYGAGFEDSDAVDNSISLKAGLKSDRGNFVFSAAYLNQDELLQSDRSWAHDALYPLLQTDGTFQPIASGSSNSRRIRGPGGNFIFDTTLNAARAFEPTDVYNYAPVNALIQPNERWQFGSLGNITVSNSVTAYYEATYNRRTSQQRLAPDASFAANRSIDTPNNGPQWNDFVPANNPFNPFGSVACANTAGANGAALCNLDVRINRRFVESGGRLFAQSSDNYRMLFGLEGDAAGISWDFAYTYAETELTEETKNYGRFDRWAIAVDPVACAADSSCPSVLNPFGDFGSISAEQMAFLTTGSLKDLYGSRLEMFALNLSGDITELNGGTAGWAAGAEHRRESGFYSPDEFSSSGQTTGGASDPLQGGFQLDEVYGEVFLPFLDNLSVDASVRYSDYDTVGSANTYKIGIDWAITDELRARATYGTGFRAPNIAELNAGASTGFPVANSPCEFGDRALAAGAISQTTHDNCKALGFDTTDAGEFGFAWQSLYETSSNANNLKPEESNSITIGFVYEPSFVNGLIVSLDYWNFEVEKVIGEPRFNVLFNSCLASENRSAESCSAFGGDAGLNFFGFPGDAKAENGNLGNLETDGIDLSAEYEISINDNLIFIGKMNTTYQNSYEEDFQLGGTIELAGTADGFGVFPEWRINSSLGLASEAWTADWVIRWFSETEDLWRTPATSADTTAESIMYHDLVGTYTYKNLRFVGGINNVTDETPPYFHSAFNANTEPGVYDVIGRRLFASVTISL